MRSLANLGLQAFFDLGEDGWNDEFDLNFLKLSVLTQGGFIDKVAATPGAPVDKDVYVFDETHPTQANKVAVYDVDTWKYFTPNEGWMLYNRTDNYFEKFDGAVWAEFESGFDDAPSDGNTYGRKDAAWEEVTGGGGGEGTQAGIAFPVGPVAGQRFYRTDRKIEYTYDGVRWLSTQLHTLWFPKVVGAADNTDAPAPVPWLGVYGLWLERFEATTYRVGAGEWDVRLDWRTAANVATTLTTLDGAGDPADTWVARGSNVGVVLDANAKVILPFIAEISGAAAFNAFTVLHYRLIG